MNNTSSLQLKKKSASVTVQKTDIEEYRKVRDKLYREIAKTGSFTKQTATTIIKRLIEVTEPLIKMGAIRDCKDSRGMASYLWNEILKYNNGEPICSEKYHYSLFSETQKTERKHFSTELSSVLNHEHQFIKSDHDEHVCEIQGCGAIKKNGRTYLPEPEHETESVTEHEIQKTKSTKALPDSIILEAFDVTLEYLSVFTEIVKTFKNHCSNQEILSDFEKSLSMKELVQMLLNLQELYAPVKKLGQAATNTIMGQIQNEINIKSVATAFQLAMCKLLMTEASYRQWAHRFGMSPRQFQRVRTRLAEWPDKDAAVVIDRILGSISCPECYYNLIEAKPGIMHEHKLIEVKKDKLEELETHAQMPRLNSIDKVEAVFSGKLKPMEIKNVRK